MAAASVVRAIRADQFSANESIAAPQAVFGGRYGARIFSDAETGTFKVQHKAQARDGTGTVALSQTKAGQTTISGAQAPEDGFAVTIKANEGLQTGTILLDGAVKISGGLLGGQLTADGLQASGEGMAITFEEIFDVDGTTLLDTELRLQTDSKDRWIWDRNGAVRGSSTTTDGAELQTFGLDRDGLLTLTSETSDSASVAYLTAGEDGALALRANSSTANAKFAYLESTRDGSLVLTAHADNAGTALSLANNGSGKALAIATGSTGAFEVDNAGTVSVVSTGAAAILVGGDKVVANMDGSVSLATGAFTVSPTGATAVSATSAADAAFDLSKADSGGTLLKLTAADTGSTLVDLRYHDGAAADTQVLTIDSAGVATFHEVDGETIYLDVVGAARVGQTLFVDTMKSKDGNTHLLMPSDNTFTVVTDSLPRLAIDAVGATSLSTTVTGATGSTLSALAVSRDGETVLTSGTQANLPALKVVNDGAGEALRLESGTGTVVVNQASGVEIETAGTPATTTALAIARGQDGTTFQHQLLMDGSVHHALGKFAVDATGVTAIAPTGFGASLDVTKSATSGTVLYAHHDTAVDSALVTLVDVKKSPAVGGALEDVLTIGPTGQTLFASTADAIDVDVYGTLRVQTELVAESIVDNADKSTNLTLDGANDKFTVQTAGQDRIVIDNQGLCEFGTTANAVDVLVSGDLRVAEDLVAAKIVDDALRDTFLLLDGTNHVASLHTNNKERLAVAGDGALTLKVDPTEGGLLTTLTVNNEGRAQLVTGTTDDGVPALALTNNTPAPGLLVTNTGAAATAQFVGTELKLTVPAASLAENVLSAQTDDATVGATLSAQGELMLARDRLTVGAQGAVTADSDSAAAEAAYRFRRSTADGPVMLIASDSAAETTNELLRVQRTDAAGLPEDVIEVQGSGRTVFHSTNNPADDITDSGCDVVVLGDLRVQGRIKVTGEMVTTQTSVSVTDQFLVENDGTGPALIVKQSGFQPLARVVDTDGKSGFSGPAQELVCLEIKDEGQAVFEATGSGTAVKVNARDGGVKVLEAETHAVTYNADQTETVAVQARFEVGATGRVLQQGTTASATDALLRVVDTAAVAQDPAADNATGRLAELANANYSVLCGPSTVDFAPNATALAAAVGTDGATARDAENVTIDVLSPHGAKLTAGHLYVPENSANAQHYLEVQGFNSETVERFAADGSPFVPARFYTNEYSGVFNRAICARAVDVTSDRRLKDNIEDIAQVEAVALVQKLAPKKYTWRDGGKPAWGLIAQEVPEEAADVLVQPAPAPGLAAGEGANEPADVKLTVDYTSLVPQLVSALQNALGRIEELEKRLA